MKTLIAYYSLDGNTKRAAEEIAEAAKATTAGGVDTGNASQDVKVLRIEPKDSIVCKGFFAMMKYGFKASRGECPEIKPIEINLDDYDEIWLGTPIWAGRPATPVNTFLKEYPVADKVTQIFTLSKSGDDKSCVERLKKQLPNVTKVDTLLDYSKRK